MGPPDIVRLPRLAMIAVLEHIDVAAFVVGARRVLAMNRLGAAWLELGAPHLELLVRRPGPCVERFTVTPFFVDGTRHYIAVLRTGPLATGAARLAERWGLTNRERMVLEGILRGATNLQIGDSLGCALKTVEHHVTSILRKANLESRLMLAVAVLEA